MSIGNLLGSNPTPNILIVITDQERAIGEWPEEYRHRLGDRLKAMKRLKDHGLSFEHAYTAASMCSPSRATFLTSQYPVVTGCTTTGSALLPTHLPNLATVLRAAGYSCYWIGKWHLLGDWGTQGEPGTSSGELSRWGYQAYGPPGPSGDNAWTWDWPDAGITLGPTYLGGGKAGTSQQNGNDHRYVTDAVEFLRNPPSDGPWCLVVSLVNPHDVHLGYLGEDGTYYDASHYQDYGAPLPKSYDRPTGTMPRGQVPYTWERMARGNATPINFANFYAYLTVRADENIARILDAMSHRMRQETLIIRFADHGEMGLAQAGMVEKFVNAYGQCTHVPLVFSNPIAWPQAATTDALASTLDLAPTLADIAAVHHRFEGKFKGTSLYPILDGTKDEVQHHVHFTYDDQSTVEPSVIRTIRSKEWVYSVYFVSTGASGYSDADWEMYHLASDPAEQDNLAGTGLEKQAELDRVLQHHMVHKDTAPSWYPANWPPTQTAQSIGGPPPGGGTIVHPLARVPGISQRQADELAYVGIATTAGLLACAADPACRKSLANAMAVSEAELERWLAAARRLSSAPDEASR